MLGSNPLRVVCVCAGGGVGGRGRRRVSAAHGARGPLFGRWVEKLREEDGGHSWAPWGHSLGGIRKDLGPGKQGPGVWTWPFTDFRVNLVPPWA